MQAMSGGFFVVLKENVTETKIIVSISVNLESQCENIEGSQQPSDQNRTVPVIKDNTDLLSCNVRGCLSDGSKQDSTVMKHSCSNCKLPVHIFSDRVLGVRPFVRIFCSFSVFTLNHFVLKRPLKLCRHYESL